MRVHGRYYSALSRSGRVAELSRRLAERCGNCSYGSSPVNLACTDGGPQPQVNIAAVIGETDKPMLMLPCGASPDCENHLNRTTTRMCATANGLEEVVPSSSVLLHRHVGQGASAHTTGGHDRHRPRRWGVHDPERL